MNDIIKNSYSLIPATTALGFAILCEKIKKDKNKIILTGAGGDELFAGYYVNFMSQILSFKGKKRKLKIKFWERNIKKFIRNPLLRDIQSNKLKKNINSLNSYIEGDKILKKYFLNKKKYKVKKFSKDPFLQQHVPKFVLPKYSSTKFAIRFSCYELFIRAKSTFFIT